MLFSLEHEMMNEFIRGLNLLLRLVIEYLESRSSFHKVFDHVRTTKRACIITYKGDSKSPFYHFPIIGILCGGRDPHTIGQRHLQPIRFV